ncbi:MAG TPA: threonine--tRNA ligase [Dehalococcoidia bacterium]|nr:threonine--tRNA ligase [Dehalococcoidia bacterium]
MSQSEDKLERMRHSASHIMAEAVQSLFPGTKFGIGPPIEDGFYYDFELPRSLTPEDLVRIEARMADIVAADHPFLHEEVSKEEARELFADQPYKLELIDELPEERVSIYRQGSFTDMCRGPHVAFTGQVKAFKLTRIAGAYWRGDERRPMLQRIYGVAFDTQEALEDYLNRQEEAARRDHRRLGRELDLFSIHDEVGPGLIHWHPKGGLVRSLLEDYWRERHRQGGYGLVYTPHIGRAGLWETSGHLKWYQDSMYSPMDIEGQNYYLKPMNCPFHIMIYKSRLRSYRDLPIRLAEFGTVYRYERSGVLHGLMRVRGFTQDDAHLFCRPDQMADEISNVLGFSLSIWRDLGFQDFSLELSVADPSAPGKYAGTPEDWAMAEATLVRALEASQLPHKRREGEAVFYGPKIDIKIQDALGRAWQCTTIQFDFWLPEAFQVEYIGEDGQPHRPYMIHRALFGSMERLLGMLVEHHAGAFPVWLAPVQAVIIPVTDRHLDYARQVASTLVAQGLRAEVDDRSERMNLKIRHAQLQKIPYMLVVGNREVERGTVSLRLRNGEDRGPCSVADFIALARAAVQSRAQN